jgi:hypothetical protein
VVTVVVLISAAAQAAAWIYPEHRDITVLAISTLDTDRRSKLEALWREARAGHESRLSAVPADATQSEKPDRIDFAAWPAIAGDHSTSARDMLHIILETPWIMDVAEICALLKTRIAESTSRSQRMNQVRDSDIRLQRADPDYATRAGSNNVHFLLARTRTGMDTRSYLESCVGEGVELNALGTYTWYHYSALLKAGRASRESLSPADRSALLLAAFADEAFAIHFLQDVFAAGHVAGTWGDAALRKGTHDYYNERGLETRTWTGKPIVLTGDAWMRQEDAQRAAAEVRLSLEGFVDALTGTGDAAGLTSTDPPTLLADDFNIAANNTQPLRRFDSGFSQLVAQTLLETPVPALGSGLGELPRFRAELGPFIGLTSAAFGGTLGGGFGSTQTQIGVSSGLSLGVRLGLGLEGILNESGDGLVFLDFGFRQDSPSTFQLAESEEIAQYGSIFAAVPARDALVFRLRLPFWLIPGDLVLAGIFLSWASPATLTQMAVVAGAGGVIPWQAGISTPLGRFQFVLGREVGLSMYGYGSEKDEVIIPPGSSGTDHATLVTVRSLEFDFPVLEYRPFRTFSLEQSSSLVFQLSGGFDVPVGVEVLEPASAPEPSLRTTWHANLRVAFDWRYYFSGGS